MPITAKTFVQAGTIAQLEADIATAIAASKTPSGDVFIDPNSGLMTQAFIVGSADLSGDATAQASIAKLNAWGTALATKLNADAGVTDVNYATNPQA